MDEFDGLIGLVDVMAGEWMMVWIGWIDGMMWLEWIGLMGAQGGMVDMGRKKWKERG